jgi:hypothetical protein
MITKARAAHSPSYEDFLDGPKFARTALLTY